MIDADFDTFIGNNITSTEIHLIDQLSKMFDISKSIISDLAIIRGSVLIKFNVSNDERVEEKEFVDKHYSITDVEGKQYSVSGVSSELQVDGSPPDDSNNENVSESGSKEDSSPAPELTTIPSMQTSVSSQSSGELKTSVLTETINSEITTVSPKENPSTLKTDVTVGESTTASSGPTPTTTDKSLETTSIESNSKISMTITIEGDYDKVVGEDKQQFLDSVKKQLADYLNIPLDCIVNMDSKPGSILVKFELIPSNDPNSNVDRDAIKAAKSEFERKIKQNQISIVGSAGNSNRVFDIYDNSGEKSESGRFNKTTGLTVGLAVGLTVLAVVGIIVIACAVHFYMHKKCNRRIRPRNPTRFLSVNLRQRFHSAFNSDSCPSRTHRNVTFR